MHYHGHRRELGLIQLSNPLWQTARQFFHADIHHLDRVYDINITSLQNSAALWCNHLQLYRYPPALCG